MQSRRHSMIEATTSTVIGLLMSLVLNYVFFKYARDLSPAHAALSLTTVFTTLSFVRQYFVRRAFNRWHLRELDEAANSVERRTIDSRPVGPRRPAPTAYVYVGVRAKSGEVLAYQLLDAPDVFDPKVYAHLVFAYRVPTVPGSNPQQQVHPGPTVVSMKTSMDEREIKSFSKLTQQYWYKDRVPMDYSAFLALCGPSLGVDFVRDQIRRHLGQPLELLESL